MQTNVYMNSLTSYEYMHNFFPLSLSRVMSKKPVEITRGRNGKLFAMCSGTCRVPSDNRTSQKERDIRFVFVFFFFTVTF